MGAEVRSSEAEERVLAAAASSSISEALPAWEDRGSVRKVKAAVRTRLEPARRHRHGTRLGLHSLGDRLPFALAGCLPTGQSPDADPCACPFARDRDARVIEGYAMTASHAIDEELNLALD